MIPGCGCPKPVSRTEVLQIVGVRVPKQHTPSNVLYGSQPTAEVDQPPMVIEVN
jgi:hypothetical protein